MQHYELQDLVLEHTEPVNVSLRVIEPSVWRLMRGRRAARLSAEERIVDHFSSDAVSTSNEGVGF